MKKIYTRQEDLVEYFKQNPDKILLTFSELRSLLGSSPPTIRRAIKQLYPEGKPKLSRKTAKLTTAKLYKKRKMYDAFKRLGLPIQ